MILKLFYSVSLLITEEKICLSVGNCLFLQLPGEIKALHAIRLPPVQGYVCLNGVRASVPSPQDPDTALPRSQLT